MKGLIKPVAYWGKDGPAETGPLRGVVAGAFPIPGSMTLLMADAVTHFLERYITYV